MPHIGIADYAIDSVEIADSAGIDAREDMLLDDIFNDASEIAKEFLDLLYEKHKNIFDEIVTDIRIKKDSEVGINTIQFPKIVKNTKCEDCDKQITKRIASVTKRNYGKSLCLVCVCKTLVLKEIFNVN